MTADVSIDFSKNVKTKINHIDPDFSDDEDRLIKLFSILLQIDQRIKKESNESNNIRNKHNTSKAK